MPRPAKHDEGSILSAAAMIVAKGGPKAATITAIGSAIGAPSGSIYHRFRTRDELLGRLWLSKARFFQDRFEQALLIGDDREAGLAAALSIPRTSREDVEGGRIMLLYSREDFLSEGWPGEMKAEARQLGEQVDGMLTQATRRLLGRNTPSARQALSFALLDVPTAATKRFLAAGTSPPKAIDQLIATTYFAVIDAAKGSHGHGPRQVD